MAYTRCGIALPKTHTATKITVAKTPLASFESNVSGLYIPEILAYIQATQAGTGDPSPSNPRAISGVSSVDTTRTGANVWGGEAITNSIKTAIPTATEDTTNKTITFSAVSAGGKVIQTFKVKENTQYTFIIVGSNSLNYNAVNLRVYYTDGTYNRITFPSNVANTKYMAVLTTPANKTISLLHGENAAGSTTLYYDESGLFEGVLTADDFKPYTGQTATTSLGGTYYGGYLNVTTGVLTVTHEMVDLGTLEWQYSATYKWFNPTNASFPAANVKSVPNNVVADIKCTIYEPTTRNDMANDLTLNEKCCVNNSGYFIVRDLDYDDTNLFKSAMNGVQLVYELATPQTYQLTPAQIEQLLGQNNVFCSTGDVVVKYWKID